ncbi:MAG: gliding motility-associated ABC transporter substrate-binding protein GldG [Bacteroidales bacterium]|nr:gliding motility-associated ABC transporter substrate-binding protein GldG [Bacteroidales bacterium]
MKKITTTSTLIRIAIALATFCIVLVVSELKYFRFDMTEEKRYTLSETSKQVLEQLDDTIRMTVYLTGDLPMSFVKMERDVSDLLNEFQQVGGKNKVLVKFIDPQSIGDGKNSFKHTIARLHDSYGLAPYTIQEEDENGKLTQRNIIPGIIVSTSKKFVTVNMLSNTRGNTPEEQINEALQNLEYQCVKAILQLTAEKRKNVAFLTGHGELPLLYSYNATVSLLDIYNVDRVTSQQLLDSLDKYDALVIAEPTVQLSEQDKFVIDQYIMNDGNVMFLYDNVSVSLDSLKKSSYTFALAKDLNLSDLLFNLGVRINPAILLDNQCAKIPMNVAAFGEQPRFVPVPWYYFPLFKPTKKHNITNNIDVVKSEFASTIDTLEGNGAYKKTVLLTSSAYARVVSTPTTVGFQILQSNPNKEFFNKYYVPTAVLLEGSGKSLYQSRKSPLENSGFSVPKQFQRKDESSQNRIIVVSDGDVIRNEIEVANGDTIPKPLYYYKYASFDKRVYTGNLDFFMNAVNYLCGDSDLLSVRSREITIRLLNKNRIIEEKTYWQLLNIVLPILLISLVGIVLYVVRKYRYSKKYVG